MRIELSWKDDDKICSSIDEARAAWDSGVERVMWQRDDIEPGKLYIVVDKPCEFDDLSKAWELPDIFDGCEVHVSDVIKN